MYYTIAFWRLYRYIRCTQVFHQNRQLSRNEWWRSPLWHQWLWTPRNLKPKSATASTSFCNPTKFMVWFFFVQTRYRYICLCGPLFEKPVGNAKEKEVELITIRTACAANLPPPLPEKAPHSLPPRATTPHGAATQTAQVQRVDWTRRNCSLYTCYQSLWIDANLSQLKLIV